ncbi:MAG: pyrroloquinoline quinone biosynthesis protein PqqE [bacterium ADurb.Bin243]|nr:MAG: pyrroloquinoline quinone biosynthesis protein PqqE [bacterium ADurb.Bin243]
MIVDNSKLILDGQKILWHKDRLIAWLNGERIAPITIDCALTKACSYKCVYCYGNLQENKGYVLNRDHIFRFLDDAAEIGVKAISFVSDGESAHSPHIYEALIRGKANGLDMALGTNGFPLKDERLEEILPTLTYLRFNISAGTPDRYSQIHGVPAGHFYKVIQTVKNCIEIKKRRNLSVTIGLQMVLLPEFRHDIMPLALLGKELGADYLVIKHCSDDENNSLGVCYDKYNDLEDVLKQAEALTTSEYLVKAKWSKIFSGGKRSYSKCYAMPFMIQMSGSGLVAPCGFLFNDKYKEKFHIGNIAEKSFKEIWKSERYWEVVNYLTSEKFNAHCDCGTLCLQHKVNEFLWDLKNGSINLDDIKISGETPMHVNFI